MKKQILFALTICVLTATSYGQETEEIAPFPTLPRDEHLILKPKRPGFFSFEEYVFNDPYFKKQNFFEKIDADRAFRILLADSLYAQTPVRIGIIDEGPTNNEHEDLVGQIVSGSDTGKDVKHGQYVLGIMAAKANNETGTAGVAGFNSQFMYRSLPYAANGGVDVNRLANLIRELGRQGADAINLSVAINRECTRHVPGVEKCYHPMTANLTVLNAIRDVSKNYGTIVVVSASNDSQIVPRYATPEDGAIVVGTATSNGRITNYSNRGPGVDIYVPETGIYGLTKNGYSSSLTGTSFGAPVVTATAAILRHYLIAHGIHKSPGEIVRHILKNATLKTGLSQNGSSGLQLNLGKVISEAQNIQ